MSSNSQLAKDQQTLPILQHKDEFFELFQRNPILVVSGGKGFGKTTQIPQWCVEWSKKQKSQLPVACTEPRRVLAISAATRVAQEMNADLGQEVGYSIRFENQTNEKTMLKYCTDGLLLREAMASPKFDEYSVIIVDEVHERSLHSDILLAWLKEVIKKRNDLRVVVILSKTRDVSKIREYFNNCPCLSLGVDTEEMFLKIGPAIMRSDLKNVVLTLKRLGIKNLNEFDFIDAPPQEKLDGDLELMKSLGALDSNGDLTEVGSLMTEFPFEPEMSRTLIKSTELGCSDDVLSIIAMLSIPEAIELQKGYSKLHDSSDHLTLLNIYKDYQQNEAENDVIKRVNKIRNQLADYMSKLDLPKISKESVDFDHQSNILKSFTAGFCHQVARFNETNKYKTMSSQFVSLDPNSVLKGRKPEWVIYNELVLRAESLIRTVSEVKEEWVF